MGLGGRRVIKISNIKNQISNIRKNGKDNQKKFGYSFNFWDWVIFGNCGNAGNR